MSKTGIFYGSTTRNTWFVAKLIREAFGNDPKLMDIAEAQPGDIQECDNLILGVSTWGFGDPQYDWDDFLPNLDKLDLVGKKVALFGLGDQEAYHDSFANGLKALYDKVIERGGSIVGRWPLEEYDFTYSTAVSDGRFVGLIIDQDNQRHLTHERISKWVSDIKAEFKVN